jgi:hypothetical protein
VIEDFHIRVDDAVLDDLHRRLAHTRPPDQIEDTGWDYGIPLDYLGELLSYWRDAYDWRTQEARLNDLPHFRTVIDGQSIHFVHAQSPHADAVRCCSRTAGPVLIVEVPRRHPPAHGPGGAWWHRRRRVPRDRAVVAGLRLLRNRRVRAAGDAWRIARRSPS